MDIPSSPPQVLCTGVCHRTPCMKVSNRVVEFHIIHLSCQGHCLLLASAEPDLVHLDLGISASPWLRSHLNSTLFRLVGGWVDLNTNTFLLAPEKNFEIFRSAQNPDSLILVHFGMVPNLTFLTSSPDREKSCFLWSWPICLLNCRALVSQGFRTASKGTGNKLKNARFLHKCGFLGFF